MASSQPTILLLFPDSENKRILEKMLSQRYIVLENAAEPDAIFVDSLAWHTHQDTISTIRAQHSPLYIPTLLYVHRPTATMRAHNIWQYVDDLVVAPIDPELLEVRLQVHLRTRRLSQQLRAQNKVLSAAQKAAQEQRKFANALREIGNALTKEHSLQGIFSYVMDRIDDLIPNDAVTIMLLEDEVLQVVGRRGYTLSDLASTTPQSTIALEDTKLLKQIIHEAQPIAVSDMMANNETTLFKKHSHLHAYAGVPIISREHTIGVLNTYSRTPGQYSDTEIERLLALADQLAIAIESARLYDRVQKVAVLEERQRLARDLHDSVTQTLFSATVMIETVQSLTATEAGTVRPLLDELHQLTRGALAETRTILLELYPSKIADLPIDELLRQITEALWSRKQIEIDVQVTPQNIGLPYHRKVAFYGIAQEALNNIVKHAHASKVTLLFDAGHNNERLIVEDDGVGFLVDSATSGFGLSIMHERAEEIGAQFDLTSVIGHGTRVNVIWTGDKK